MDEEGVISFYNSLSWMLSKLIGYIVHHNQEHIFIKIYIFTHNNTQWTKVGDRNRTLTVKKIMILFYIFLLVA